MTAYDGEQAVAMASSGADGFYRITLPVDGTYRIRYSQPQRFSHNYQLRTTVDFAGNLIGEEQYDVVLDSLPVGRPFQYTDLFGPDAVVDLSTHGVEMLQPLINFLTDNPMLQADLTLRCDLTDNADFNALLTESRLQNIATYLRDRLPAGVMLHTHNGCQGSAGCSDATGDVRLTVILK